MRILYICVNSATFKSMRTIQISKAKIDKEKGVVILPIDEYIRLRKQSVPTYYLKGKAAILHDKLVEESLREYKTGKTKKVRSLSDLD